MKSRFFPVVIEQDEDGFFADCRSLQGCHVQGKNYEETLTNLRDAVQLHIEDRLARDEPIPTPGLVSLTAEDLVNEL